MRPRQAQVRIDTSREVPAYRQIADQLRTLVMEGALDAGDSLPSVRRLALELGLHFNTVAQSYRMLADEGLLEITHGHRARVGQRPGPIKAGPDVADGFRQRLRELVAGVRARGLSTEEIADELTGILKNLEGQ